MTAASRLPWASRALAMAVGRKIRDARRAKGWTAEELASRLGSHRPVVTRVERGRHLPSIDTLAWYAYHLEVPLEELVAPANILQRWL